ncbi:MAG: GntR family transcriptional regulator [Bacillota bacterium]
MFSINYRDPRPLYEQITDTIEKFALSGILKPDEKLPSVRELAMQLSINPNTIQKAYSMLDAKGITYAVKGKGIFIAPDCSKAQAVRLDEIKSAVQDLVAEAKELGATQGDIESWIKN